MNRPLVPVLLLATTLSPLVVGCGDSPAPAAPVPDMAQPPPMLPTAVLKVEAVEWNLKQIDVGKVAAVAELGTDLVVMSDTGTQVLTNGLPLAADPTVKPWVAAAVVPAADHNGQWVVGVDGTGRIRRLRNRSTMEDVSDRYGLSSVAVRDVANVGNDRIAFALDGGIAVSDGDTVTRFDGVYHGLAGSRGLVVGYDGSTVRVFDPGPKRARVFKVPGVVAVALDALGKLVVATADTLWLEQDGHQLAPVYRSPVPIHGLALAGNGVWVATGDTLSLLAEGKLKRGPAGIGLISTGARIVGSGSGDVWVIGEGGSLTRYSEDSGGGPDERLWKQTVQPVFTRTCSLCHLPGGVSGIDLSTYAAWTARRALVGMRVLDRKPTPMPPAGAGILTPDELGAIDAWVHDTK